MLNPSVPAKLHVELSADELRVVSKLLEDQLFRVKFIDPKMPGHRRDDETLRIGEAALVRLKAHMKAPVMPGKHVLSNIHVASKARTTSGS